MRHSLVVVAACLLAIAMILPSVALGQEIDKKTIKVTASSWEQKAHGGFADFPPELTLDGKLDAKSSWRADGKGQWIQYDLGAVKQLGKVRIAFPSEDNRSYKFDIQVSKTGAEKDWTTVTEKAGSNPKNARYKTFKLNGVKARYMRIVGRGNTSETSPNQISIKEVMIIVGGAPAKPSPLPSGVTVQKDIEYVPKGGKSRTLDLYRPQSAKEALPVLVFIHGGGWRGGSKDGCPAKFLAQHGYAVASINYRLSREAKFPAPIEDCRAALRFLRAQAEKYRLQPDRVAVWGGSAGGHLAALVGTSAAVDFSGGPDSENVVGKVDESVRVQAVIDMYGASDLALLMVNKAWRDHGVSQAAIQLLGSSADDPELMKKSKWASPVTYVGRDTPPFLIQHGDADRVMPLEQARVMDAVLKKAGVETTLMVMPGAGHAGGAFFSKENQKTLVAFLDRHLKQRGVAPSQKIEKKAGEPATSPTSAPASSVVEGGKVPSEFAKAIDAAMQLPVGEERLKAFITVGIEWSKKEPIPAMLWASKLRWELFPPNPTLQVPMKVSYALGKGKDARIVADWFISPECDAGEKGHWFYDLIQMWGEVDSEAALAWALQMPKDTDAVLRFKCFLALGNGWIAKVKKSGGALNGSELFSRIKSRDDRLAAVMGAATKGTDIPTATAWVKKLEPGEARLAATVIAQQWKKIFSDGGKRDEAAIKKWLDQLPLSDSDKEDVLKNQSKLQWSPRVLAPYRSKDTK